MARERSGGGHDVESGPCQAQRVLLGAAPADAHERIESRSLVGADHRRDHVHGLAINDHPVRLVATRAQDGSADSQDAREVGRAKADRSILGEAFEAIAEAQDVHVVRKRSLGEATDGCVEPRAVAARRQDPDATGSVRSLGSRLGSPLSCHEGQGYGLAQRPRAPDPTPPPTPVRAPGSGTAARSPASSSSGSSRCRRRICHPASLLGLTRVRPQPEAGTRRVRRTSRVTNSSRVMTVSGTTTAASASANAGTVGWLIAVVSRYTV